MRRPAALVLIAALGLGATGAAAMVAVAARTVTVPAFDTGGTVAHCDAGTAAAFGGFQSQIGKSKGLVLTRLQPTRGGGFAAGAANVFVNDGELTALAYCSRSSPGTFRSRSVTVPAHEPGHRARGKVTVPCPAGTVLRAGGFRTEVSTQPGGPSVVVNALRRNAGRLVVRASNQGAAAGELVGVAECGPGPSPKASKATAALPDAGGRAAAKASCPAGERLAFGGFRTSPDFGKGPFVSQLKRTPAGAWRARAFQFPRKGGTVAAIAYCEHR